MTPWLSRLLAGLALVVLWLAMWKDLSLGNVVSGTLVAALALWITAAHGVERSTHFRAARGARYLVRFVVDLAISSTQVARDAVWPPARISPGVTTLFVPTESTIGVSTVANRITLTPGTLTLTTRPVEGGWELDVHVLRLDDDGVDRALRDVVDDTLAMLGLTPEEDR